jgi:general secretion pathway protein C
MVRTTLKSQNLHTRELRFKFLEERHLKEDLILSEEQKRALYEFNPCLRERQFEYHLPGLMIAQDIVDFGKIGNIGQTFLHAAIDTSCCLAFATLAPSSDPAAAVAVLNDQALAFYRKEGIAVLAVLVGKGLLSGTGTDPDYEKFLQGQGITLTLPPAGDQLINGFIERFVQAVHSGFLSESSGCKDFQDAEALQSAFGGWLGRYNRESSLPGYPIMSRTPLDAFHAAAAPKAPRAKAEDKPALQPEPPPALVSSPAAAAAVPPPPDPRTHKQKEQKTVREIWGFRAINAALLCLLIYFGWVAASRILDYRQPQEDLGSETAVLPQQSFSPAQETTPPLEEYHAVWDRNLFNVSRTAAAAVKREQVKIDTIALAGKNVGLKLIGTVVANDPKLNYAVIEIVRASRQAIFRENDRAENVIIKQIFRNNVIISTSSGEQRLATGETNTLSAKTPQVEPQAVGVNFPEVPGAGAVEKEVTLEIPRGEIAEYLPEIDQMLRESNSSPSISGGKPDGFTVGRLRAHDLLFRIGLRTGDVIQEVNGEQIDNSEDVASLIQGMAGGGQFSVVIKRSGQVQQLNLSTR